MNKETLEHYGWLIIAIILLTFLLAFASPLSAWTIRGIGQTVKDAQGASGVCEHTNTVVTEEWQPYNETQHEKVKITTCTSCGKVTQTLHTGTYATHHWDANYICTDCGYQHIHNYNQVTSTTYEEIAGNSLYHYRHTTKRCVCGATIVLTELELHEYGGDNVCDLCGYERHEIVTITDEPHQIGTLTYNKTTQQPTLENYDITSPGYVYRDGVPTGVTQATNAGSYTMTFTLQDGFVWSSTGTKTLNVTWTIGKATPTIANLPEAIVLSALQPDYAFTMKMKYMDADVPGNIVYSLSNTTYAQLKDNNSDSYYDKVSAKTPITPGTATLSLTCNPTDTENYNPVSGSTAVVVTNSSKAAPSISADLSNPVEVGVGLNVEVTLTTPTDVEFNSAITFNSTYVTAQWKNNNPSTKILVITGVKVTGETSIDLSTIETAQYLSGTYNVRVTVVRRNLIIIPQTTNFGSSESNRIYATQTKDSIGYRFADPSDTSITIPKSQVSSADSITISSANTEYVTASINPGTMKFSITGVKATTSTINVTISLPESTAFNAVTKVLKVTKVYKLTPTLTLEYANTMQYGGRQVIYAYSESNGGISASSSTSNISVRPSDSDSNTTGTLVAAGTHAGQYRYTMVITGSAAGGSSTLTFTVATTDIYESVKATAGPITVNKKQVYLEKPQTLYLKWHGDTACYEYEIFYDEGGSVIDAPSGTRTKNSDDISVTRYYNTGGSYYSIKVEVVSGKIATYKAKTSITSGILISVKMTSAELANTDYYLYDEGTSTWKTTDTLQFDVVIPRYQYVCPHNHGLTESRIIIRRNGEWDGKYGVTYDDDVPEHIVFRTCDDCGDIYVNSPYAPRKEACTQYLGGTAENALMNWSCHSCGQSLSTNAIYCGSHCGYFWGMRYKCNNPDCPLGQKGWIVFNCGETGTFGSGDYPHSMRWNGDSMTFSDILAADMNYMLKESSGD